MSRRWLLGGYLLLMISLVAGSEPRLVGDGGEYLQMAQSFGSWQWPRAEITHFWFYSALASPLVNVAELAGLHPLVGFTGLNFILLGTAFLVVCKRLEWALSFLLFTGPVVWWVDKAHTEVFSFSLLAIAFALMTEAPWWAMICAGAASTQNPPIAALIPLVAALSFTRQPALRRDWRLWTGGALAMCLALLHPIYYQARLGRLSPLIDFTRRLVPNRDEFVAVVWDPNIGLLWSFPGLVLVAGIGLIGLLCVARARIRWSEILVSGVCGLIFLFSFSQKSQNSGGTRHMSRYAIWLIPLMIPLLRSVWDASSPPVRRWLPGAAIISCIWTFFSFHPGLPGENKRPTWLAEHLWTRHPSFSNPLPEIFIERIEGRDGDRWVPVATGGCEKILLMSRPDVPGTWPLRCPPVSVPPRCAEAGAMCYANLLETFGGYEFTRIPTPTRVRYEFARDRVWSPRAEQPMGQLLRDLRWWELEMNPAEGNVVHEIYEAEPVFSLQGKGVLFLFMLHPRPGARLTLGIPEPMTGQFVNGETGQPVEAVRYDGVPGAPWDLMVPTEHPSVALILTGASREPPAPP